MWIPSVLGVGKRRVRSVFLRRVEEHALARMHLCSLISQVRIRPKKMGRTVLTTKTRTKALFLSFLFVYNSSVNLESISCIVLSTQLIYCFNMSIVLSLSRRPHTKGGTHLWKKVADHSFLWLHFSNVDKGLGHGEPASSNVPSEDR